MKFYQKPLNYILGVIAIMAPALSLATPYDWSATGHLTFVEATYVPNSAAFTMDSGGGSCAAGSLLNYTGGALFSAAGTPQATQQQNVTAVYAALMAALMTNKTVTIYGYNAGCSVQFVHLNPN